MRSHHVLILLLALLWAPLVQAAFDPRHPAWDALLKQQVVVASGGVASTVRYAALQADPKALRGYLASVSAVTPQEYASWSRTDRLAFLINAYNAFTIDLVLTRYPDLKSIKDLASVFQSPWKRKAFTLIGEQRSLDDLEHGLIRAPGVFDDPRINVAVVCASVGCPMLREEAYVGERLGAQLDDAMRRFLSDRSRNRFEAESGTLSVSKLFDWYHADFDRGHQGLWSLQTLFIRYADTLGTTPASRAEIRAGRFKIVHLDYDRSLNDAR
ncbi:MAG: DUF547 domain-containing protein [Rhizobiales bacterium]|nr:DUF547 domain-containing protein [Rhizobacter sp.]